MNNYSFTVLLSASIPSEKRSIRYQEDYTKIRNAQIQIEEAVIGLSRNIFQAGGKVIFGGHPSISPLVAMVATEFGVNKGVEDIDRNRTEEKAISIFQSKAFKKVIPKETTSLFDLGYSDIIWTDAVDGEEFDPNIKEKPQCEKSLASMRKKMMSAKPDALVSIGGMEGVELEFDLFRHMHPLKPVFLLGSTGGASKILVERFSNSKVVRVLDGKDYSNILTDGIDDKMREQFSIIPYSFITALIVKEIIKLKEQTQ